MAKWSIDILRKKGEHLGVVEAANQEEAYLKAINAFGTPVERQNRIVELATIITVTIVQQFPIELIRSLGAR